MAAGSFALVLHGHLPWVLHHGRWPHGEEWLFEAVAETWLPLLDTLDACKEAGGRAPMAVGLTPVLLEQLAAPPFAERFRSWLSSRESRAEADAVEFVDDGAMVALAENWARRFAALQARFDALDGDIVGAFAARWRSGDIEIMGSAATHAYLPLLRTDAAVRAQIEVGLRTSERHLGQRPTGFWMPECAFRPQGPWKPPVLDDGFLDRAGLDTLLAAAGVTWSVIDEGLLAGARSRAVVRDGDVVPVGWDQAGTEPERGWRSPLEPHKSGAVTFLARHRQVSEQVWSARVGYPGDGRYLEFHKKHGGDGLRYWRVTSAKAELGRKARYEPDAVAGAVYSHAQHFAMLVRSILQRHNEDTGRRGVVVAPFDAELFGHWWHEGPAWLRDVLLTLGSDDEVDVALPSQLPAADKVVSLPEGSWGEGGDHRVWLQDGTKWAWEVLHRAEQRLSALVPECSGRAREVLAQAARELVLMQASDWLFMVTTEGAADYGWKRFAGHAGRFDRLCDLAQDLGAGKNPDAVQEALLAESVASDAVFSDLDVSLFA